MMLGFLPRWRGPSFATQHLFPRPRLARSAHGRPRDSDRDAGWMWEGGGHELMGSVCGHDAIFPVYRRLAKRCRSPTLESLNWHLDAIRQQGLGMEGRGGGLKSGSWVGNRAEQRGSKGTRHCRFPTVESQELTDTLAHPRFSWASPRGDRRIPTPTQSLTECTGLPGTLSRPRADRLQSLADRFQFFSAKSVLGAWGVVPAVSVDVWPRKTRTQDTLVPLFPSTVSHPPCRAYSL